MKKKPKVQTCLSHDQKSINLFRGHHFELPGFKYDKKTFPVPCFGIDLWVSERKLKPVTLDKITAMGFEPTITQFVNEYPTALPN